MRDEPWTKPQIAGVSTLVIVFVIGLLFLVLWATGVLPKQTTSAGTLQINGRLTTSSRQQQRVPDTCSTPTEEELAYYTAEQQDTTLLRICPPGQDGAWDETPASFVGYSHTLNKDLFELNNVDEDVLVELTNVKGAYYNLYIKTKEDMWSSGFAADASETAAETKTGIDVMVADLATINPTTLVMLQGTGAATPCTSATARDSLELYTFDVVTPVDTTLNSALDLSTLTDATFSDLRLNGFLRLGFRYIDYVIKLNATTTTTIRVFGHDCQGKMGDKAYVTSDGTVQWYDHVADAMVTTRNDDCLSFWNGNIVRQKLTGVDYEDTGDDELLEQQYFSTAFRESLVGITMNVNNASFGTATLKAMTPSQKLKFKLSNSKYVKFRGILTVDGVTSENVTQQLIDNPKYQVVFYDMPDLSLSAELTIV